MRAFHFLDAGRDPEGERARVGELLREHPVGVAFIGIGENSHIAFNDPPADFETEDPFIVVQLDEACRSQLIGEGWFPRLVDVPERAVSMSVKQVLQSAVIGMGFPRVAGGAAIPPTDEKTPALLPGFPNFVGASARKLSLTTDQEETA